MSDSVRPTFPDDPDRDPLKACTGGRGNERGDGRELRARGGGCATCGLRRYRDEHCPLYERCDRCRDADNPCAAAVRIREGVAALLR